MKRKTAALYDPYLDTLGGGEKHILSIMKVLAEEGYELDVFWDTDLSQKIGQVLDLSFSPALNFKKNIFKHSEVFFSDQIKKNNLLKNYDIFLYVTDGSYFFSSAKKTVIFCMVPDKNLFKIGLLNRLKTTGSTFISNSQFTKNVLKKTGIHSEYIYPYIEDTLLNIDVDNLQKDPVILSVSRFFKHLHAKRQDMMIEYFQKLKKEMPALKKYKLILAGNLKDEDEAYFEELKKLAGDDDSIILKPNISYDEKIALYKNAQFYWHFAGFNVDENIHPELTEHLGITPLEAMSAGCIDFCYRAGGLKEIINDTQNGFLFNTYEELAAKIKQVIEDNTLQNTMKKNAQLFVKNNFSYLVFKDRVKQIILK